MSTHRKVPRAQAPAGVDVSTEILKLVSVVEG